VNTGALWLGLDEARPRVLEIQTKLHRWSVDDDGRRFDDLFNLVTDPGVLRVAWERVRTNRGARTAGVDGDTASYIRGRGEDVFLAELRADLRAGRFVPLPVRERLIPKSGGRLRRLGIPTVRDRVVQAALKLVLEPIFEADFDPGSYGFRPKRRAMDAIAEIHYLGTRSYEWVLEADIEACFDALDPKILEQLVCERISDRRVLKLLRGWLRAGVLEGETLLRPEVGSPQGSPISPLLANIYLNALDRAWEDDHGGLGVLVRYCDDLVILCTTRAQADAAMRELQALLAGLRLELADAKTRLVYLDNDGGGSFDFLGFHHQMVESFSKPGWHFLARWPSARAM
jgi:RNA-directed DNA polymerase